MRRAAGQLAKSLREMAAAQLGLCGKFGQGKVTRKIGFKALDDPVDTWRHGPGPPPVTGLIADGAQHPYGQRLGQPFEIQPSVRAPVFGFFHQKPAQLFEPLVDRKKSVPKRFEPRQGQAHLVSSGFNDPRRETKPSHPAVGPFPLTAHRQQWREDQDVITTDAMVVQAKLRNRDPRVPLFCPWAVPKAVSVALGDDRCRRLGRELMDRY